MQGELSPDDVLARRDGDDLILQIAGTDDSLRIEHHFQSESGSGYQIDGVRFGDQTVWDVAQLRKLTQLGGNNNDILIGDATSDTLDGGTNDDQLYGAEGNDELRGGDQNDVLDGGSGHDLLLGQGGTDTLYGMTGDDTLIGGSGNDRLLGGEGNDTYVFGRGFGSDIAVDYDMSINQMDVLAFDEGIAAEQVWFRRSGDDLLVKLIGTGDQMAIQNWYAGSGYHIERFQTSDGKILLDTQVDTLVSAMAEFAPPISGQATLPTDYQSMLNLVIPATWI